MKSMLSHYGMIIISAVLVFVLLAFATPLGTMITNSANGNVDNFKSATDEYFNNVDPLNLVYMADGNNQIINKANPGEPLSFRSTASIDSFKEVKVDGEIVDSSNYTVTEGSTIVTFTDEYVQSLSEGEHEISIVSENGVAKTTFNVTNQVDPALNPSGIIPEDAIYYVGVTSVKLGDYTGATATYKVGDKFPETVNNGDVYVFGDYEYRYSFAYGGSTWSQNSSMNGWGVKVLDNSKESYGDILASINNKNITSLYNTFDGCTSLTKAPTIPSSVTSIASVFSHCTNLTTAPAIPSSVTLINYAFYGCTSLTKAPAIPSSVKTMNYAFYGCTNLTTAPVIPSSVTDISNTFSGCTSLTTAPVIPSNVKKMDRTFENCKMLTGEVTIDANPTSYTYCFYETIKPITLKGSSTKLYAITNETSYCNVTIDGDWRFHSEGDYNYRYDSSIDGWKVALNLDVTTKEKTSYGNILSSINGKNITSVVGTFSGCTNLTTAPVIPSSVKTMNFAFSQCKSLKTAPSIPSGVTTMSYAFSYCPNLTTASVIPSSVTDMSYAFDGCTNLTTAPAIPSSVQKMSWAFKDCKKLTGEITIDANPTTYHGCFSGVNFGSQNLSLTGNSTMLKDIGATGGNYYWN